MSSGTTKVIRGSLIGTGAAIDVKTVGFRPRSVHVINVSSGDEAKWTHTLADAAAFKRVAAGTGALITSDGITPIAEGFTLGADTDLNVSGEIVHWEAIE